MNSRDFNRLLGLLAKLNSATSRASLIDGSFRKYHTESIEALKSLPYHLDRLEQGLKTAKIIQPEPLTPTVKAIQPEAVSQTA